MPNEYIVTAKIGAGKRELGSFSDKDTAQEYIDVIIANPPANLQKGPEGEDVILDIEKRPLFW